MPKCYDMPFCLSTKMHTIVTERKKLAVVSYSRWGTNPADARTKSEYCPGQLLLYHGSFHGKVPHLPVFHVKSSPSHTRFGPPGAGLRGVGSSPRGWIESTEAGNRTPQLDTSATGYPGVCPQPGRKGKRLPRVRHRVKCFCRRSAGRSASLSAALSAGFARNPQRALSYGGRSAQSFPHGAGTLGSHNPRRGLPPGWFEILPSFAESRTHPSGEPKESCFFGVKIFSYPQSQF